MNVWFTRLAHTTVRELRLAVATRRGRLLVIATLVCSVVPSVARIWLQGHGESRALARPQFASISTLFGPETAGDLSAHAPTLVSLSLILLLSSPLLLLIAGHDWVSRDVADRTFRVISLRTSWGNLLLGKFIALWLSVSALLLLCHLLVSLALCLTPNVAGGAILISGLKLWSACALAALPYAALVMTISAMTGSAPRSLIVGVAAVVILILVRIGVGLQPALAQWLLPSQNDALLLREDAQVVAAGLGRVLVWSAACLVLGSLVLRRRDI